MSAALILRRAYGDSIYKRAARDFGVSVNAIRWWSRFGFPRGREEQVRRVLAERLEQQAREIQLTLDQIRGIDAKTHRVAAGASRRGPEQTGAEDQR